MVHVKTLMTVSAEISYFDAEKLAQLCAQIAELTPSDSESAPSACDVALTAGSTLVEITSTYASEDAQAAATSAIAAALSSEDAASAWLRMEGITAVGTPTVSIYMLVVGKELNVPVTIGAIVGSLFGCVLLVVIAFVVMRKQSKVEA